MPFGNLGTIWSEIGLNTQKLDQGLMAAQLKLSQADNQIMSMGQRLTNNSTKFMMAGGLMVGTVAGIGIASVKMASQFETSMRNVNSISKLSEAQFKKQADAVLTLSTKLPQSAKVLADGLYDIASSGFQGSDGLKVLEASAKAASAGLTDTAISAKGITAVLNAYGLEAKDAAGVSDTMFKTVDKGVISFEELSSTIGDWVGMAKAANLSFNEASGAIAYMTTKGISAAEAGTSLQRMLTGIIKPSDEMAAVIKNAGFESGEMMLKTLGLTGSMKILNDATGGSITKLIELIPEIRGVRGANALLGAGYEELTDYMKDFNDTSGATDVALKEQSKSLEYQMKLLKNNANAVVIALGSELIPSVTKYVTKLTEFIQTHKEGIATLIKFGGAAIGAVGGILLLAGALGKLRMIALAHPLAAVAAAIVALNIVVDLGAGKLEEMDNNWATIGATLLRTVVPFNAVKDGISDLVKVNQAYLDGLITFDERANTNIFTMNKTIEKIDELRAAEAEKIVVTEANIEEIKELYDSTELANIKLAMHAKAQRDSKTATEENTGAEQEQVKTIDELRGAYNDLITTLFDGINANNNLQESQWAVEDATKAVAEAEKELEKAQKATGGTFTANNEALQAYLSTNVEYLKNSAKANELQEKINKLISDGKGETSAYYSAVESLGKVRSNLNEITAEGAKITGTYNSTGQQTEKQMVATAEKTRELEQAQNDLDRANQQVIDSFYEVYTSLYTTKEEQDKAKQSALEYGLQMVETGQWGEGAFISMASQFGMSAQDIIAWADKEGIEIDYATRNRILNLETSGAIRSAQEFQKALDSITDVTVNASFNYAGALSSAQEFQNALNKYGFAMGGIVGYDTGGIVGIPNIPTAASGMVVPQTGRAIPILAHEGEMILNDSQQGNLINALWGVANGKGTGGKDIIVNLTVYSPDPITPAEVARQTRNTLRSAGLEALL